MDKLNFEFARLRGELPLVVAELAGFLLPPVEDD